MHLFAYGTLMVPQIWQLVTGRDDVGAPAVLRGYRVRRVEGDLFPVMLRCDAGDESASGLVFYEIDYDAWSRLDAYESPVYDRVEVEATLLHNGQSVVCQAYVLSSSQRLLASDDPWSLEWFQRNALREYMRRLN